MELKETPGTNITTLPPAQRAAVVLKSDAAEKELRELIERTTAITTVVDKNGRTEAHAAAMALKLARVDIEKAGKVAREDATAFSKAVIAEAARLTAIAEPEEDRLLALRDEFDAKIAAEKAEKDRIEAERKSVIMAKIGDITSLAIKHAGASATELHYVLSELAQRVITEEEFAEFTADAQAALDTTAHALLTLRTAAQQREAEEAERLRLAEEARKQAEADRLELEKLRAQQAEDARIRAEEVVKIELERAADRAVAAQKQAESERELAEARAQVAAANAKMEAAEAARRIEREAAEKIERDHAEALDMNACWTPPALPVVEVVEVELEVIVATVAEPNRPTDLEMVEVLATHYGANENDVARWLCEIDRAALIGDLS